MKITEYTRVPVVSIDLSYKSRREKLISNSECRKIPKLIAGVM